MFGLNRTFKDEVETHVKTFLELVKEMYGNLRQVVKEAFGIEGDLAEHPSTSEDNAKVRRPSLKSFKVLTECPIAVVLVFQTWRQIVFPYIKDYFPLVMEVRSPLSCSPFEFDVAEPLSHLLPLLDDVPVPHSPS